MKYITDRLGLIYGFLSPFLGTQKMTVLFSSFQGQYSDNPRYISEELHKLMPDLKIIWSLSMKVNDVPPDYVTVLKYNSPEYAKAIWTSQVVIDNHLGLRCYELGKKNAIKGLIFRYLSRKRKRQFCISTWHGAPIKKIASDAISGNFFYKYYVNTDYLVSGCKYVAEKVLTSHLIKIPIQLYGSPRNDVLFSNGINIQCLKQRLGIPIDRKVILFAPTFRDVLIKSGVMQMADFDFPKFLNALSEKFGGKWCFVFRAHNLIYDKIQEIGFLKKDYLFIDGNQHDDMAEYLSCSDILLTDYSSCMFDYALTGKPCFLYAPDLDYYANCERGFYLNLENLPFPMSTTFDGLLNNIISFDNNIYKNKVSELLSYIENVDEGCASHRVAQDICKFIISGVKSI